MGAHKRRLVAALSGTLLALGALGAILAGTEEGRLWIQAHLTHPIHGMESLNERGARRLFPALQNEGPFRYDPVALLIPEPASETTHVWSEHPEGSFVVRVNERGIRADGPTPLRARGPRVLVAGDSHTQGFGNLEECYTALLESRLRQAGHADLDVLNAGCAYTGPTCYRGMLERHHGLAPDVFVAALFVGNDFSDEVRVKMTLDGWSMPRPGKDYWDPLVAATERWPGPVAQGMNQAVRFKRYPGEKERAFEMVCGAYRSMRDRCAELDIEFIALVLPTRLDVDAAAAEDAAGVRAALDLTPEEAQVQLRLTERFLARMGAWGIRTIDATDALRDEPEPCYWATDDHLAPRGHEVVAELLADALAPLL